MNNISGLHICCVINILIAPSREIINSCKKVIEAQQMLLIILYSCMSPLCHLLQLIILVILNINVSCWIDMKLGPDLKAKDLPLPQLRQLVVLSPLLRLESFKIWKNKWWTYSCFVFRSKLRTELILFWPSTPWLSILVFKNSIERKKAW